jgi:hypothetical protein
MPEQYFEDDYFSVESSVPDKKQIIREDKHQHIIYREVYDENKDRTVKRKIIVYSSGDVGNTIRNAQFGTKYIYNYSNYSKSYVLSGEINKQSVIHKIGSYDEDLYFKVMICTGENKQSHQPITLFYSSPGQYERHLNEKLSPEVKKQWNNKRREQLLKYKHNFIYKEELPEITVVEHEGYNVVVH